MAVHSKNTFISLGGTDISNFVNDFSIDDAADEVEVTGFGHTSKQYVAGFREISASMSGNWGANDGTGLHALLAGLVASGASSALIYGPAGSTTGNVRLNYDAIVTSFSPQSSIGGAVTFSTTLRLQNPTSDTFPA